MNFLVDERGVIQSFGREYSRDGDDWVGTEAGIERERFVGATLTMVSADHPGHRLVRGVSRYVDGAFSGGDLELAIPVVRGLFTPEMMDLPVEEVVSRLNAPRKAEPIELADFFGLCARSGAVASDFRDIWKYDGFRERVIEALSDGDMGLLSVLVATMPWTISEASANAVDAVIGQLGESAFRAAMRAAGLPPRDVTVLDVLAAY